MTDLNEKVSHCTFCALDLETTGADPFIHRIIEIGMVRFSRGTAINTYCSFVDPGVPIPGDAYMIHGITDDMVAGSPKISDLLGEIKQFIDGAVLVIHNPLFDLSFLDWVYREAGSEPPPLIAFDTVRMARKTFPLLKNHKLTTIKNHFQFKGQSHRAMADAEACMKTFNLVIELNDPEKEWHLTDLMAFHGNLIKPGIKRKSRVKQKNLKGIILGKKTKIVYADNKGRVTEREILPIEYVKYGKKNYLLAQCYLRNARRYFKIENIIEVLDLF